jgi:hypothetical protein
MIDRVEATRRGSQPRKTSTKHPYAAIEHRVIDSPAYADLTFSAQALLVLMARQLTKNNNGQLQATFSWCKKFGVGSEHTLRGAVAELISHGFIYRTRSHGANGAWAKYGVTWISITEKKDLFLAGFKPFAWRDWEPSEKKTTRQKVQDRSGRKCSFTPEVPAESAGKPPVKNADYELVPRTPVASAPQQAHFAKRENRSSPFAIRLVATADRGPLRLVAQEKTGRHSFERKASNGS